MRLFPLGLALCWLFAGCGSAPIAPAKAPELAAERGRATGSRDSRLVGRWLIRELFSPSGEPDRARQARRELDALESHHFFGHLAIGIDDDLHGKPASAAEHFLKAGRAAWQSQEPEVPLVAWYAIERAKALGSDSSGLRRQALVLAEQVLERPSAIGWRAVGQLLAWWAEQQWNQASPELEERIARRFGCLTELRLAGPFGSAHPADSHTPFPAEDAAPWPSRWAVDPASGSEPRQLEVERRGCTIAAAGPVANGVFYAETYVNVREASDAILAAQGALGIWVDDESVLLRDPRDWGSWARFGVALHFPPGRHRIVVKTASPEASLRVLKPDGTSLGWQSDLNAEGPYGLSPVSLRRDPNLLSSFVGGLVDERGREPRDDVMSVVAAELAHGEGLDDVAQVLLEPLVREPRLATGPALATSAVFALRDPLFPDREGADLSRGLQEQALAKDPLLWSAGLGLVLHKASSQGLASAARDLEALSRRFPDVPALLLALGKAYGELGWTVEQRRNSLLFAERFPESLSALLGAVQAHETAGNTAAVAELLKEIERLDGTSEVALSRALEREDHATALLELNRLLGARPERESYQQRLLELREYTGDRQATLPRLELEAKARPSDSRVWLDLADAHLAAGEPGALDRFAVRAIESGADGEPIALAQYLVSSMTEIEPFRIDGAQVIADYERTGRQQSGTAARVLDYSVISVASDGSSVLLEHEIVRVQSDEAVSRFAEQQRPAGLVLNARVVKRDGRTFEPELVAEKPTITFPHIEAGDYVETEYVTRTRGTTHGLLYAGPRWYFREEQIGYARSELVVIAPQDKPLFIETTGEPPAVVMSERDGFIVRRWRLDDSPPAPSEPFSPPVREFLPSVRLGWGPWPASRLIGLVKTASQTQPVDPRISRVAERMVDPLPPSASHERASRVFHWVMDNVRVGDEQDGRRVVMTRQGNRWQALRTLYRALGIDSTFVMGGNRLAPAANGPLSASEQLSELLLKVETSRGSVWTTATESHAPFGYIPAASRGMPAYELTPTGPGRVTVPEHSSRDLVTLEGKVQLDDKGQASLDIIRRFEGEFAATMREALSKVAPTTLRDVLESRVLSHDIEGASLTKYRLEHLDELDAPLLIYLSGRAPHLATSNRRVLSLAPPFVPNFGDLVALPERKTPLLIQRPLHRLLRLHVKLPRGATARVPQALESHGQQHLIAIRDRMTGDELFLDREIRILPGRISAVEYPVFAAQMRTLFEALTREIRIELAEQRVAPSLLPPEFPLRLQVPS